jgi:hypothetical protein
MDSRLFSHLLVSKTLLCFLAITDWQAGKKKDKGQHLPPELKEQWDRDRVKKAEKKAERELQRLIAAADPLIPKKGGKKGRKAMRRAAAMGADDGLLHHVVDMVSLEREIRRFITNLGGGHSMALPPMTKEERKKVHELANAFNLKSVSKGKGADRYTTLIKTTRSGLNIDERKIGRVLRTTEVYIKGGRGPPVRAPKHREGDEVGKVSEAFDDSVLKLIHTHRRHPRSESQTSDTACWKAWAGQTETESVSLVAWRTRSQQSSRPPNLVSAPLVCDLWISLYTLLFLLYVCKTLYCIISAQAVLEYSHRAPPPSTTFAFSMPSSKSTPTLRRASTHHEGYAAPEKYRAKNVLRYAGKVPPAIASRAPPRTRAWKVILWIVIAIMMIRAHPWTSLGIRTVSSGSLKGDGMMKERSCGSACTG